MALTTKPKSGAMSDSVKNISAKKKNDMEQLKYPMPSSADGTVAVTSPFPPKKPMTTSPFPPKKPAMKKAKGGMVRGTGCAVRGTKTAKQY